MKRYKWPRRAARERNLKGERAQIQELGIGGGVPKRKKYRKV